MWASPIADVGESRYSRWQVPAQMWLSPGADVGKSHCRCGRVPAQMWASAGVNVHESQRRCGRAPAQMGRVPAQSANAGADEGESRCRCEMWLGPGESWRRCGLSYQCEPRRKTCSHWLSASSPCGCSAGLPLLSCHTARLWCCLWSTQSTLQCRSAPWEGWGHPGYCSLRSSLSGNESVTRPRR